MADTGPSAAPRTVRFLFDYISSNAYLAWVELPKVAAQHGYSVELVPVLFAGLLEAHGQLGPAEVRPKAWWMFRNNLRKAAVLGLTLRPPRFHPFNPLLPLRVSSLPLPEPGRSARCPPASASDSGRSARPPCAGTWRPRTSTTSMP